MVDKESEFVAFVGLHPLGLDVVVMAAEQVANFMREGELADGGFELDGRQHLDRNEVLQSSRAILAIRVALHRILIIPMIRLLPNNLGTALV